MAQPEQQKVTDLKPVRFFIYSCKIFMMADKAVKADFAHSQGMFTLYRASPYFMAYPQCIVHSNFMMSPKISSG